MSPRIPSKIPGAAAKILDGLPMSSFRWTCVSLKNLKLTALINAYSMVQIPLLGFIAPESGGINHFKSVIRVRLDRRTRNHLGVMYFGALAMGAELSIALKAITEIADSGQKIDFIFKDLTPTS